MSEDDKTVDALVAAVAAGGKYRHISPDLVRAIGVQELTKRNSFKSAVKATKNKLHQVGGSYQPRRIDYQRAVNQMQSARTVDEQRQASRDIMRLHTSTRERLPVLDDFYRTILAGVNPPRSVLDIACGLNPLAIPWMPLADSPAYIAYDIYSDMMGFLQSAMELAGVDGQAETRDIIHNPPQDTVDLALILKTLPCLEQLRKGAAAQLLDSINARYLLVSYPVSSLGGREKGMIATYDTQFETLAAGRSWATKRFLFDSELAFLVDTQGEKHVKDS